MMFGSTAAIAFWLCIWLCHLFAIANAKIKLNNNKKQLAIMAKTNPNQTSLSNSHNNHNYNLITSHNQTTTNKNLHNTNHQRTASKTALNFPLPGVSIIKPLLGVDANLKLNLETYFKLQYPTFELLFCVQDPQDPACKLVQELLKMHPDIDGRLFVGDGTKVGVNPKINNMEPAYAAMKYELLLISDSAIAMRPDTLLDMVAHLTERVGLVHQIPFVGSAEFLDQNNINNNNQNSSTTITKTQNTNNNNNKCPQSKHCPSLPIWKTPCRTNLTSDPRRSEASPTSDQILISQSRNGSPNSLDHQKVESKTATKPDQLLLPAIVEKVFFGTWHARAYLMADMFSLNCATGMSTLIRKQPLDEVGGLKTFSPYLAEDYFISKSLTDRGWRLALCSHPALQNSAQTHANLATFYGRIERWMKLRFAMVPFVFLFEPFSECLICGLLGSAGIHQLSGYNPMMVLLIHSVIWLFADYYLMTTVQPPQQPLGFGKAQYLLGWLVRELTAPAVFVHALFNPLVTWRSHRFRLRWGGLAEELLDSDVLQQTRQPASRPELGDEPEGRDKSCQ